MIEPNGTMEFWKNVDSTSLDLTTEEGTNFIIIIDLECIIHLYVCSTSSDPRFWSYSYQSQIETYWKFKDTVSCGTKGLTEDWSVSAVERLGVRSKPVSKKSSCMYVCMCYVVCNVWIGCISRVDSMFVSMHVHPYLMFSTSTPYSYCWSYPGVTVR